MDYIAVHPEALGAEQNPLSDKLKQAEPVLSAKKGDDREIIVRR